MQQQKLDEAIQWLEKAKQARRYEPRHFPYLNRGRVYAAKGMLQQALEEFRGAVKLNPDDPDLPRIIEELENKLQCPSLSQNGISLAAYDRWLFAGRFYW